MNLLLDLQDLLRKTLNTEFSADELIQVIDLTLLDETATPSALEELALRAVSSQVAAVCVYPRHLPYFQNIKPLSLATVINFPHGNDRFEQLKAPLDLALEWGVAEIDYVFSYEKYLKGEQKVAFSQCEQLLSFCKEHGLKSKVILETGAFISMESLYEAACNVIDLGCDFLKTSTGKIAEGASLPAAFILLSAIKNSQKACGLKISGGVKTKKQAAQYANLAEIMLHQKINASWFRLGASALLQELKQ